MLKGSNSFYDVLWRNLREDPPPDKADAGSPPMLQPLDMPSALLADADFTSWYYYMQSLWDEKLRHESEGHYYANGGRTGAAYPGSDAVLHKYLRDRGIFPDRPFQAWRTDAPDGFTPVERADGRKLLVSNLVTIRQMKAMFIESGYGARRSGDLWEPGNSDDPEHLPAAATWLSLIHI